MNIYAYSAKIHDTFACTSTEREGGRTSKKVGDLIYIYGISETKKRNGIKFQIELFFTGLMNHCPK